MGGANEPTAAELDQFVDALDALINAMSETTERATSAVKRAESMRQQLRQGMSARDIILQNEGPLLPEIVTSMLRGLLEAGSRVRRQEAQALHAEGLSMEAIGQLFGVSRQRVSTLLHMPSDAPGTWWGEQV